MMTYIALDIIEAVSLLYLCVFNQCVKCIKSVGCCPNIRCEFLEVQFNEIVKANKWHRDNGLTW